MHIDKPAFFHWIVRPIFCVVQNPIYVCCISNANNASRCYGKTGVLAKPGLKDFPGMKQFCQFSTIQTQSITNQELKVKHESLGLFSKLKQNEQSCKKVK